MPEAKPKAKPRRPAPHDLPIYLEIQRDIERKIIGGAWKPGDRVPAEHELVKSYGCSRMTVNKALSALAAAGLIVRKRRSGSFVAMPRIEEPLLTIQDIRTEVLATDRAYRFDILYRGERVLSDPTDARHVGVPVGTRMLCLDVMHYADNLPFTLETRQINLSVVPEAADETFAETPPGTWLLRHVPWTDGEHSLRAVTADGLMAKQLEITPGAACISITRRTWRADALVTFVRFLHPGDRHRFVVRFGPGAGVRSEGHR